MAMSAKLMNTANPVVTGGMHGVLPLHQGMRVCLLEHLDQSRGLVKDAEGVVVHVAINPLDEDEVREAQADRRPVYLRHLPLGVWVRMDKYAVAPFRDRLAEHADSIDAQDAAQLVFMEPQPSNTFEFHKYKVIRTALPISHAQVLTSTASQGRTMSLGVTVDAGCKDPYDMDNLWLHLYVMLSRATTAENLLVIRDPGVEFLDRGPPLDLGTRLRTFETRTTRCRDDALRLASSLGLSQFLHN